MKSDCCNEAESLALRCRRPFRVVAAEQGGVREFHITLEPVSVANLATALKPVRQLLDEHRAEVVRQEIFAPVRLGAGASEVLWGALGKPVWPVTWVDGGGAEPDKIAGMHLTAVAGAKVESIKDNGRVVGCLYSDRWFRHFILGGVVPDSLAGSATEQTREVFGKIKALLNGAGMNFKQTVRTWFFLDDILSWYGDFNRVRTAFFEENKMFGGVVPASTGVGVKNPDGAALTAGAWAVQPLDGCGSISAIASPLQCAALDYGSSFSRAVELAAPDCRHLTVSGTASIAPGGESVHNGDMQAQIRLTMDVVGAILASRGMGFADVTRSTAYFKSTGDVGCFEEWRRENGCVFPSPSAVHADVCRDELLFELEADAVCSR